MDIDVKWWSIISVLIILLITVFIIDGNKTTKNISMCKAARIRPFPKEFFTWNGIVELNTAKQYQPSCL